MKNEIFKEKLNRIFVEFALDKKYIDENIESLSTKFRLENEEDNILYFYYHILDIAKGIIDGSLTLNRLPKNENVYFETHEYAYHTKELLQEYMQYLIKEIRDYENYKSSLIKNDLTSNIK